MDPILAATLSRDERPRWAMQVASRLPAPSGTFSRRMADRSGRVGWVLDVVCAHLTLGGVARVE